MQLRGGHSPCHHACHKQPCRGPCCPHSLQAHRDLHLRAMHGKDALCSHCRRSAQVLQISKASGEAAQDLQSGRCCTLCTSVCSQAEGWHRKTGHCGSGEPVCCCHPRQGNCTPPLQSGAGVQGSSTHLVRGLAVWVGSMLLLLLLTPLIQCLQTADMMAPYRFDSSL